MLTSDERNSIKRQLAWAILKRAFVLAVYAFIMQFALSAVGVNIPTLIALLILVIII